MDERYQENQGNVAGGFIGALLGALVGAIVWALVGMLGYIASIVGFLIAFLAGKGYDWFKGRPGKIKVVILVLCVILAVFIGNIGSYAWMIHDVYQEELALLSDLEKTQVVSEAEFFVLLAAEPDLQIDFFKDFAVGLLFAGLGCFGVLRDSGRKKAEPVEEKAEEPTEE